MGKDDDAEWQEWRRDQDALRSSAVTTPRRTAPKVRWEFLVLVVVLGALYSFCKLPNWSAADSRGMDSQEQRDALHSPLTSEEKRRAVVFRLKTEIRDRLRTLREVAAEDSPAADDAQQVLDDILSDLSD